MSLKLRFFNIKNRPEGGRSLVTQPLVTFGQSGNICFNKASVCQFTLKAGMKISFACDEKDSTKWYWFLDIDNGLELKKKGESGMLQFHHAEITKSIQRNFPSVAKSVALVIGETIIDDGLILFELKPKIQK